MKNFVITIARGYGTGGKHIAEQLAEELGVQCYENRILTLASQESDVEESRFVEVDEKLRSGYFLSLLKSIPKKMKTHHDEKAFVSDDKLFEYQSKIIRELAKNESCVIVGKCADFVLRDFDHVVSIYIEAPRAFTLPIIMKRENLSEEEASARITRIDKYRADYYKYYTNGREWTDPVNYDMTFNSQKVGRDKSVAMIKHYLKLKSLI